MGAGAPHPSPKTQQTKQRRMILGRGASLVRSSLFTIADMTRSALQHLNTAI
jgi:hypothetical protein